MEDRVTFEYAIIRVVPKVEREEFFNVGVILFSKPKKYLDMKYHIDVKKLNAFNSEITLEDLEEYLNAWEEVCKGEPHGGTIGRLDLASRFRWLTACRSTIIQSSQPHPGLTNNPLQVLNELFHEFVIA